MPFPPLPPIPQINLANAVAAGAIGSPSAVGTVAEVVAGGIASAGLATGLLRPLTAAAAVGSMAAATTAAASMAAVAIPVAGSTLLFGNAISAADEGRLKEHLVNEGRDFASHVMYAAAIGGAVVLLAPTTPFTMGTVLIAAASAKATNAVTKRLLQCTSAGDCAFKVSNPNSLSGGSYTRNSKSRKSNSIKSKSRKSNSMKSKSSSTRFFTISIVNEKSVETKRITLETKKHVTREVFKKEIEKVLNVFMKPMTEDELK